MSEVDLGKLYEVKTSNLIFIVKKLLDSYKKHDTIDRYIEQLEISYEELQEISQKRKRVQDIIAQHYDIEK